LESGHHRSLLGGLIGEIKLGKRADTAQEQMWGEYEQEVVWSKVSVREQERWSVLAPAGIIKRHCVCPYLSCGPRLRAVRSGGRSLLFPPPAIVFQVMHGRFWWPGQESFQTVAG